MHEEEEEREEDYEAVQPMALAIRRSPIVVLTFVRRPVHIMSEGGGHSMVDEQFERSKSVVEMR